MKKIAAIGLLTMGLNAYACPNFTGEWDCSDTEGDKWTESVVTEGNKYTVTYEKGTPNEKTDVIVADGRKVTESATTDSYLVSILNGVGEKLVSILPQNSQQAVIMVVHAGKAKINEMFKTEAKFSCHGNSLQVAYSFIGSLSIPLIASSDATGSGVLTDTLQGNERRGNNTFKGNVQVKLSGLGWFASNEPTMHQMDKSVGATCKRR